MSNDNLSFVIVGGCFPVQDNISPDKLYHSYLSQEVKYEFNLSLNFDIIRYERFSDCLDKIKDHHQSKPADVLLFHFRSEHFLRLCKLVFRYQNGQKEIKRTLNLLFCNMSRVEDFDYLSVAGSSVYRRKHINRELYRFLVETNYLLGFLTGNVHFALKRYEKLAAEVSEFCKSHEVILLLAGPASRPHTWWEDQLTNSINRHMKRAFDKSGLTYIELLGTSEKDGEPLFFSNGVQVNEAGHRRIAKLILDRMDFLKKY